MLMIKRFRERKKRRFDSLVDLHARTCEGSPKLKEHAQLLRLMQFLMRLDDVFNSVRSIILTTEPIHDVKYAFATLSRYEYHKNSYSSSKNVKARPSAFAARPINNNWNSNRIILIITTIESLAGCQILKKGNVNQNNVNNVRIDDNKSNNSKSIAHTFISDQYQRLMSLLSEADNASKSHASITGASQHITFCATFLYDIIDVTHLNLTVALPNETVEQVKQYRNYKIRNNLIVKDVLVVPGYKDLTQKNLKGTGSGKGAKLSREPIQISEHKSKSLGEPVHLDVLGPYKIVLPEIKNTQFKTKVSVSDSDSVDVTSSTSSKKDTSKEKYVTETSVSEGIQSTSLNDDEYESEGEDIESFSQLFEWLPEPAVGQTIRRTSRKPVLPSKYNDYVLNKNVKYGIDKVINYVNLSLDNYVFTTSLNKIHEPATYLEAIKDMLDVANGICLTQRKYCTELFSEFGMLACKPFSTPIEANPKNKKAISKFGDDEPLTDMANGEKADVDCRRWKGKMKDTTRTRLATRHKADLEADENQINCKYRLRTTSMEQNGPERCQSTIIKTSELPTNERDHEKHTALPYMMAYKGSEAFLR
ncbi:hypothetical protein Tco_1466740 [Tanacetum coccineum]